MIQANTVTRRKNERVKQLDLRKTHRDYSSSGAPENTTNKEWRVEISDSDVALTVSYTERR
jgi:hypothetical protein